MFRIDFFRLNARPYRWRGLYPVAVALLGGPWHPSRPYTRLGAADNFAATVRARGNGDWTEQAQADFFLAQWHLAEHYKIVLAHLDKNSSNNVKTLNFNRSLIIATMIKTFGAAAAQRLYYKISGEILRGYYSYGLSQKEIQEHVAMSLQPVVVIRSTNEPVPPASNEV